MKSTLLEIGLSEKEADLYLLLVQHKEMTASTIAKITNNSRTHVYDTIQTLTKKGLIVYVIKNNIKYFKTIKPERLLDFIKDKESKIKEEKEKIYNLIPLLRKMQENIKNDDSSIEIYEGVEGLKSIMNDIIREGKDFVTIGATDKIKDYLPDYIIKRYLSEREKKNIKSRQLFTNLYGVLESPLSDNRKMSEEFASPTTTAIYGNKIAIILYFAIPKVILIENIVLAKAYKQYFELLWKTGEK